MTVLATIIFGGSDTLKPAPVGVVDRCVCLTDDPALTGIGWEIRVYPASPTPRRAAWALRCQPDLVFPDADVVIWLDASMWIRDLPALIADAGDGELVGMHHPERSSCYDEGPVLIADGKAAAEGVARQLDAYRADGFMPTDLTTAGILVRRRTPIVRAFNERWLAAITEYPDDNCQLSLDYCAWKEGLAIQFLKGTYIDNTYLTYDLEDHATRRRPYR